MTTKKERFAALNFVAHGNTIRLEGNITHEPMVSKEMIQVQIDDGDELKIRLDGNTLHVDCFKEGCTDDHCGCDDNTDG